MSYFDETLESVQDEVTIDIYADPSIGQFIIAVDRPFKQGLVKLELYKDSAELLFVFEKSKKTYGEALRPEIIDLFLNSRDVELFQFDMRTKQPVAKMKVPLEVH